MRPVAMGFVVVLVVLHPEMAMTLYMLLMAILAVRANWLFYQGLNELRRRYRS